MTKLKKVFCFCIFLAAIGLISAGLFLHGQSDLQKTAPSNPAIACPERIPAACQALLIPDRAERHDALYRALAEALQAADPAVRSDAFDFLAIDIKNELDILPLAGALWRYDELDENQCRSGHRLLDEAYLCQAPQDERIRVYATAIARGEAAYGTISYLSRQQAVLKASPEKLTELAPIISAHYNEFDELTKDLLGACAPSAAASADSIHHWEANGDLQTKNQPQNNRSYASGPNRDGYIRAAMFTAHAIRTAIGSEKPGVWDYEVAGRIKKFFEAYGFPGLPCWTTTGEKTQHIVASGPNAVKYDFHYWPHLPDFKRLFYPGELALIDTGASCLDMCSDVTRTFPIDIDFTDEQRLLYSLALSTFKRGQEMLNGINGNSTSLTLGYLEGRLREIMTFKAGNQRYYCPYTKKWEPLMHFVDSANCPGKANYRHGHQWVHYVGWNHDAHGYNTHWSGALRPPQVFALEIGIYIPEVRGIGGATYYQPAIGIRIEDTFMVETNGKVVCLSCQCPKEILDIVNLRKQALAK
jgi:hypothetical protein